MKNVISKRSVVGLGALVMSQLASAASLSYVLNQNNAGLAQADYIQVTISDSMTVLGDIDFNVQLLPAFDALNPGSNFGMQSFYFNYDASLLNVGVSNIDITNPDNWTVSLSNDNVSQYGRFDITTSGLGSSRTSLLTFSISGVMNDSIYSYASVYSDTNGSNMPELFAAHVGGFDSNGISSAYFAGSELVTVPLPAALWLFGSGILAVVGFLGRKK